MSIRVLGLIGIGLLLSGCATTGSRWHAAQQQDTVAAYKAFLLKSPDSKYAAAARGRIEQLKFEQATQACTVQALQGYLREYSQGDHAAQAKERIEDLDWAQAKRANTVQSYDLYLKDYATGKYAVEAKRLREESLWNAGRAQQNVTLLRTYLREYPQGAYQSAATSQLAELYWRQAEATQSIPVYRNYLQLLPDGPHAAGAREVIECAEAEEIGTKAALESYLAKWPQGRFSERTKRNLRAIQKETVGDPGTIKKIEAGILFFPAAIKAWWSHQGMVPSLSTHQPLLVKVSSSAKGDRSIDFKDLGVFHGSVSADVKLQSGSAGIQMEGEQSVSGLDTAPRGRPTYYTKPSPTDLFYTQVSPEDFTIAEGFVRFDGYLTVGNDRMAFSGEITCPTYSQFAPPEGLKCTLNGDSYEYAQGSWRYGLLAPLSSEMAGR